MFFRLRPNSEHIRRDPSNCNDCSRVQPSDKRDAAEYLDSAIQDIEHFDESRPLLFNNNFHSGGPPRSSPFAAPRRVTCTAPINLSDFIPVVYPTCNLIGGILVVAIKLKNGGLLTAPVSPGENAALSVTPPIPMSHDVPPAHASLSRDPIPSTARAPALSRDCMTHDLPCEQDVNSHKSAAPFSASATGVRSRCSPIALRVVSSRKPASSFAPVPAKGIMPVSGTTLTAQSSAASLSERPVVTLIPLLPLAAPSQHWEKLVVSTVSALSKPRQDLILIWSQCIDTGSPTDRGSTATPAIPPPPVESLWESPSRSPVIADPPPSEPPTDAPDCQLFKTNGLLCLSR
ncbi:hypothetical protein TNCV_4621101 [Trichonephila clavipes]|nr:hypothetical protein TNCV_4621101 [Trichonephila clavipes]